MVKIHGASNEIPIAEMVNPWDMVADFSARTNARRSD